jgi:hypothetical protein
VENTIINSKQNKQHKGDKSKSKNSKKQIKKYILGHEEDVKAEALRKTDILLEKSDKSILKHRSILQERSPPKKTAFCKEEFKKVSFGAIKTSPKSSIILQTTQLMVNKKQDSDFFTDLDNLPKFSKINTSYDNSSLSQITQTDGSSSSSDNLNKSTNFFVSKEDEIKKRTQTFAEKKKYFKISPKEIIVSSDTSKKTDSNLNGYILYTISNANYDKLLNLMAAETLLKSKHIFFLKIKKLICFR